MGAKAQKKEKKKKKKRKPCPICGGTICSGRKMHEDNSPPAGLMERFSVDYNPDK